MSNFKSAVSRIKKADTPEKLAQLEVSFSIIHQAGQLTDKELQKLFDRILEKMIKHEGNEGNEK